jgi:radical SAM protein with 4Fe4S-binding SPASM domain
MEFYRPIGKQPIGLDHAIEAIYALNRKYWKGYKIANAIPFCFHKPEILHRIALGGLADDGACRMVVDTQGDIKPSYYSKPIGNLKGMTLYKAWNSLLKQRFLEGVQKQCTQCIYLHTCRGGSKAMAGKDPLMKKPITGQGNTRC